MALPSSSSSGKCLTEEMILNKTRVNSLLKVRSLNIWGEQLANILVVSQLQNVTSISLVSNRITILRPFAFCSRLEELYLRNNFISSLSEFNAIRGLKHLKTLWLMGNPCASQKLYREFAIFCGSALSTLDDREVSIAEREAVTRIMTREVVDGLCATLEELCHDGSGTCTVPIAPFLPSHTVRSTAGGSPSLPASKMQKTTNSASCHSPPTSNTNRDRRSCTSSPVSPPPSSSLSVGSASSLLLTLPLKVSATLRPASSIPLETQFCKEEKSSDSSPTETPTDDHVVVPSSSASPDKIWTPPPLAANKVRNSSVPNAALSSHFVTAFQSAKSSGHDRGEGESTFQAGEREVLSSIHTLLPSLSKEALLLLQDDVNKKLKALDDQEKKEKKL